MGKHEAPRNHPKAAVVGRKCAKVATHHATHIVTLVSLHAAALVILEKSPILLMLGIAH